MLSIYEGTDHKTRSVRAAGEQASVATCRRNVIVMTRTGLKN